MGEGTVGGGVGQFGATRAGVVGGAGQVEQDLVGPRNLQNPAQDAPTLPLRGLRGRDPQELEGLSWGRRKSQPGLPTPPGTDWPGRR